MAPRTKTINDGMNNSMRLSNMFRDTLGAPFCSNTDVGQVHQEPFPLALKGALSRQE